MGFQRERQVAMLIARQPRWFAPAVNWSVSFAVRSGSMWPRWVRRAPLAVLSLYVRLMVMAGQHER